MNRLVLLLLMSSISIHATTLEEAWDEARKVYILLKKQFQYEQTQYDTKYLIPGWNKCQNEISELILGPPQSNFLKHKTIVGTMIRLGFGPWQKHELHYILNSLPDKHTQLITSYKDTTIGGLTLDMPQIGCTSNSMSQLYIFSRILNQKSNRLPHSILEWGGGFGNLARITKQLIPESTYFIVDLLPLLSLQYLFLRASLPEVSVKVHYQPPNAFEPGYIHLIPLYLVKDIDISVDALISAFAITECPFITQKMVCDKSFFDASALYISGITNALLDPQGNLTSNIETSLLKKSIDPFFEECITSPHYIIGHYELIANK